jgi:hypothetical protein
LRINGGGTFSISLVKCPKQTVNDFPIGPMIKIKDVKVSTDDGNAIECNHEPVIGKEF